MASCFGGHDEQMYLIEIMIEKLILTPAKIKDIGKHSVVVKVSFLEFPMFEITREDFACITPTPLNEQDNSMEFFIGRSCIFVRQPRDLVHDLRTKPVFVGIFRVGDTYPIAEAELSLPGCLCDQIAMSTNDLDNLPKPFSVKGGFHLKDTGDNPAGQLDMELRLTCFGRLFVTHYELRPQSFIFRNGDKDREFSVKKVDPAGLIGETQPVEAPPPEPKKKKGKGAKKEGKGGKKKKK